MASLTVTTRQVVLDYVRFRLNEAGICGNKLRALRYLFAGLPIGDSMAMDEVRCVGRQMEAHIYHSAFLDMSEQQFDVLGDCAKADYTKILVQLFADKNISWGRLILVIVYTGRLTVKAMKADNPEQVRNIIDWCQTFFRENYLDQWIEANGGWENLKGVSGTDWQRKEMMDELKSFVLGLTIMVGVVALGFYILQRK